MTRRDKIQQLLTAYLLDEGSIELQLPDGLKVELGILKEDRNGDLKIQDNYSWLIASQKDREVSINSYNLALRFMDGRGKMILEDGTESENGLKMRCFSVI